MKGIYSGSMQGQIVYLNEDAQYLLAGSMFRIQDQHNLTQDLLLKQNSVDWKSYRFRMRLNQSEGQENVSLPSFLTQIARIVNNLK